MLFFFCFVWGGGGWGCALQLEYVVTPLEGIKSLATLGKTVLNSAAGCSDAKCRFATRPFFAPFLHVLTCVRDCGQMKSCIKEFCI